ncbi:MAG: hypothetical protein KC917_08785 [Candidatus Omnitrophica bacterium]|nr:hypothetical protein [Candidatus Omnitrophota bacterium]
MKRLLIFLFLLQCATPVLACQYTVRDVGFVELEPRRYTLYVLPDESTQSLWNGFQDSQADSFFAETNVRMETLASPDWRDHADLKPLADRMGELPKSVLVSEEGRALVLDNPIQAGDGPEEILSYLQGVIESPVRDEITNRIVRSHCVALVVEGKDYASAEELKKGIEKVQDDFAVRLPKMDKPAKEGPKLVILSPEQANAEKILLWSLGIDPEDLDSPAVAIFFGRCRVIGGAMTGEDVTLEEIDRRIGLIGESCECELDRSWMQGKMIPLEWDMDLQEEAAKTLGFDPENPMVKMEISQILEHGSGPGPGVESFAYSDDPLMGYSESEVFSFDSDTFEEEASESEIQVTQIVAPAEETEDPESKPRDEISSTAVSESMDSPTVAINHSQEEPMVRTTSLSAGSIAVYGAALFFLAVLAVGLYILISARSTKGVEMS